MGMQIVAGDQLPLFIRRENARSDELALEFSRANGGIEAALCSPGGKTPPLRLVGMCPRVALATARDLAALHVNVAIIDRIGDDDLLHHLVPRQTSRNVA